MSSRLEDAWVHLRALTPARIALGRVGGSLPTKELLAFSLAHAAAKDAVWSVLDGAGIERALSPLGLPVLALRSLAPDRLSYLARPDLGRLLSEESKAILPGKGGCDVCILLGDGLSATAAERHGPPFVSALVGRLRESGLLVGPICVVSQARVALEDEVGALLDAKVAVIALGERPGLGSQDSLGAYLVHGPRRGRSDAERNCVSNIRTDGLPPQAAAELVAWLISESLRRGISGVELKDDRRLVPGREVLPSLASR